MSILKSNKVKLRVKRTFLKQGTCSRTFFYILNREFGHPKESEERAIDPMAGGILQNGYQCGMLWGATMAIGAESFRRCDTLNNSIRKTIRATQHVMESFRNRAKSIECEDITTTDFKNKWSFAKYMFTGKFYKCFKLAEKWAPEAIKATHEGLDLEIAESTQTVISCASEVVKMMGGNEEEMSMVAGFAGGIGLSGNACGALAASIWKTILELVKTEQWKSGISDPYSEKVLKRFYETTNYKMECHEICGKRFESIEEHTEFIKTGGCKKLLEVLSQA